MRKSKEAVRQLKRKIIASIVVCTVLAPIIFNGNVKAEVVQGNTIHVFSTKAEADKYNEKKEYLSINEAIKNASANDTIYIHKGIYRETVTISKSNISIKNYSNDKVYVSGMDEVTGWKDAVDYPVSGVKVAKAKPIDSNLQYTQVLTNGQFNDMARFPNRTISEKMLPLEKNSGYAQLRNITKQKNEPAYATVVGDKLPTVNIKGGIFRGLIGKNRDYPLGKVVSVNNDRIGFTSITKNDFSAEGSTGNGSYRFGFGYIMHKNLIDIPGEWYLENNNIYYMPPKGTNINTLRIEMQTREKVLIVNHSSNVAIQGIHFYGGNADISNATNFSMNYCSMQYLSPFYMKSGYGDGDSMRTGIYLNNATNCSFKSTYVGHTWGTGFSLGDGCVGTTFKNCRIEDIGWIGNFTSSILVAGKNTKDTKIEHCTFKDNGRFQIRVRTSGKITILDNEFIGAMKLGEDAGPIEMTSTGSLYPLDLDGTVIAYNKVHDVHGIPVTGTTGYLKQFAIAFYMEDVMNYTAHHNVIYNIVANNSDELKKEFPDLKQVGGFLYLGPRYNQMNKSVNYYNNTVYNLDKLISIWHIQINNNKQLNVSHDGGSLTQGHFENNIFQNEPCGLSYSTQNLNSTGGQISSVSSPDNKKYSIDALDFNAYAQQIKEIDYKLNPKNNQLITFESGSDNFRSITQGDFSLRDKSSLKGKGLVIPGITQTGNTKPDVGAYEGGNRVTAAGCTINQVVLANPFTSDSNVGQNQITVRLTSDAGTNQVIESNTNRKQIQFTVTVSDKKKVKDVLFYVNRKLVQIERIEPYRATYTYTAANQEKSADLNVVARVRLVDGTVVQTNRLLYEIRFK